MKKRPVLYFTLFFSLLLSAPLPAEEIKVGYNHLSNLIEKQEGSENPVGRLVNYWEDMAVKMGVSIKWVGPLPSTRIISYLKNGEIDAIYLASKTPYREAFSLFPEKPIFIKQPIICFRKGKMISKPETWNDLQTLEKIGVVNGHSLAISLTKEYPDLPLALIKNEDPVNFALTKLANGELDAFIYPGRTGLVDSVKESGFEDLIVIVDAPVPEKAYYACFAANRRDLVKKYNAQHGNVTF